MNDNKVIFFDQPAHDAECNKQEKMQELFASMLAEAEKAHVQIEDYKEFINDPAAYCIDKYWEGNAQFFAAGITKEKAIEGTGFNPVHINKLFAQYQQAAKRCKGIKINKKSLATTVDETDYNHYLEDEQKDHYEAVERYIEAAKELAEHENGNMYEVVQAFDGVTFFKGIHNFESITVNPQKFKKDYRPRRNR